MQTPSYSALASAISSSQQTDILLADNPPFAPSYLQALIVYVGGEAIQCTGVDPNNQKHMTQISRGYSGTKATPHSNGAFVVMGAPAQFSTDFRNGSVLSSSNPPLSSPQIDLLTGQIYALSGNTSGEYQAANLFVPEGLNLAITPVADVAYTVLITDCIVQYTSLTAARVVTLPAANRVPRGHAVIIKDGVGTAGADNITVTATIDGGANKVINANYGIVRVYSDGTAWFTW